MLVLCRLGSLGSWGRGRLQGLRSQRGAGDLIRLDTVRWRNKAAAVGEADGPRHLLQRAARFFRFETYSRYLVRLRYMVFIAQALQF